MLRLKSHRKFCTLGDLASQAGWTKADVVSKVEAKRVEKAKTWYDAKVKKDKAKAAGLRDGRVKKFSDELKKLGF